MPRTSEKLRVVVRPDTGALTIVGTVAGVRVRQRAETNSRATAEREAVRIAQEILARRHHGEKLGSKSLQDAIALYLRTVKPAPQIVRHYERILRAMGEAPVPLADITQDWVNGLVDRVMRPGAKPNSITTTVIVPLKACMNLACDQRWCAPPRFKGPKAKKGEGKRIDYYMPVEALRLMAAAPSHFRPILLAYLCTGMRHTEALTLDWADVNLVARTLTVRAQLTKNGIDRIVKIMPVLLAALSSVPEAQRQGAVFRRPGGQPYLAYTNRFQSFPERGKDRQKGGIEVVLDETIKRAGVKRLTCHHLRHTWASWWYAANGRDLLGLQHEGSWGTLTMVARYAHHGLIGHEDAIKSFWHVGDTGLVALVEKAS